MSNVADLAKDGPAEAWACRWPCRSWRRWDRDPLLAAPGRSEEPPLRMAFLYVPNGVHMPDWTPRSTGAAL